MLNPFMVSLGKSPCHQKLKAHLPATFIQEYTMVSQDLLEILRCPACVREKDGLLDLFKDTWLVCRDCGRKYPIRDDIPVMLIDEGDKWVNTAVDALSVPPPP